ncbi:MAG: DUF5522 domain-containing protein [Steroidobacterales bacterium]
MTSTEAEPPKAPEPSEPLTVQPVDFYLERGLMVFTAAYHLQRGYCCGNRCRHCPFQEWNS